MRFSIKNNHLKVLLILVFVFSNISFLAIKYNNFPLKIFSAITFFFTVGLSVRYFLIFKNQINNHEVRKIIFSFLSIVLLQIIIDVLNQPSFKSISDGVFIVLPYYTLSIIAIPAAVLVRNSKDLFKDIYPLLWIFTGISLLLYPIINFEISAKYSFVESYKLIDNCLIIGSFFIFSRERRHVIIGSAFLIVFLLFISYIASRSYFLVWIYFVLLSLFFKEKISKTIGNGLLIILLLVSFSYSQYFELFLESNLVKKIQIESLIEGISTNKETKALDYEGDSRSLILKDAFGDFDLIDFIVGRGIFSKYHSFVDRNTIEVGWLQQVFWFGIIVTGLQFYIVLKSLYFSLKSKDFIFKPWGALLLIKLLDGFIYGMPQISMYSFLFFIGIYLPYTKKTIS